MNRFWAKVDRTGPCWLWLGRIEENGYGRFRAGPGRLVMAHRFAYELLVGPIPEGLELDHLCFNPACVNPAHLEPVTGEENLRRAAARVTHCKRGHAFDGLNDVRRSDGRRRCRICTNARQRRYYALAASRARGPQVVVLNPSRNSLGPDVKPKDAK